MRRTFVWVCIYRRSVDVGVLLEMRNICSTINLLLLPSMKFERCLRFACIFFMKSQLELVRVTRKTSRHRHGRHPSRRGSAQTERLRTDFRVVLDGNMEYSSWFVKGVRHAKHISASCMHQTLPQPTITRRVGMTNVSDIRRQWSSSHLPEATALAVVALSWMRCCRSQPRHIL